MYKANTREANALLFIHASECAVCTICAESKRERARETIFAICYATSNILCQTWVLPRVVVAKIAHCTRYISFFAPQQRLYREREKIPWLLAKLADAARDTKQTERERVKEWATPCTNVCALVAPVRGRERESLETSEQKKTREKKSKKWRSRAAIE